MAGGGFGGSPANKIKGGKWTVIRFFLVSMAFTVAWMTVSSLLGHYKLKYGPQILLQMNIAYFLPSIPLLVASSFLDDWLDKRYGIAKTILFRLLFGLGGCAMITAAWPFAHSSRRMLLSLVVVLGLVAGIAFSASYQLVARFANKNTISLGLGCVGSGIATLIIEVALHMGPNPTRKQELILFEITAALVVLGALAALSLLLRHWKAIEASMPEEPEEVALGEPLLSDDTPRTPTTRRSLDPAASRSMRKSLSTMLKYAPLDPFDTMSDAERMVDDDAALLAVRDLFAQQSFRKKKDLESLDSLGHGATTPTSRSLPQSAFAPDSLQAQEEPGASQAEPPVVGLGELMRMVWPIMAALFVVGTILCTVFPFFTYVPSSGLCGDDLPKVLFFARLFADLTGRTLPRIKALAMTSQRLLFSLACLMLATLPLFFFYLKSPARLHSDYVAVGYIVCLWAILGYINTCAYILAPQRVPPAAKGAANGALAIIYQGSHCLGLLIALGLAVALYGSIHL